MPGINLICNFGGKPPEATRSAVPPSDAPYYEERYQSHTLLTGQGFVLGFSAYPEYPLRTFETGAYWFCTEGRIYDKDPSTVESELPDLAGKIFQNDRDANSALSEWLLNTDGDFVVVIYKKKANEFAIFNDSIGRLQLYYSQSTDRFMLSREIRFVVENAGNIELDRMSIAQYLLFSYTLGKKTLFNNVYSQVPASLIRIDLKNKRVTDNTIFVHNFESCQHGNRGLKSNSDALAELFSTALVNRVTNDTIPVVSLSGGLDSRTVCAALKKNDIPFHGATFLDYNLSAKWEFEVAERLTRVLDAEWHGYRLPPPRGQTIDALLKMKYGMNWLGMSFMLPFYDMIKADLGTQITYFSGDGGGETMHSLKPVRHLRNAEDVIRYVSDKYPVLPFDIVASLAQVSQDEFLVDMSAPINAYPETTFERRFAHFMVFERNYKWAFEGEDRNRHYFWSATPFYSIHFFNYAMNCPEQQKLHLGLYGEMMSRLNPAAAALGYAHKHGGITPVLSSRYNLKRMAVTAFPALPRIKRMFKKPPTKIDAYAPDSNWILCLRDQIKQCQAIHDYLDRAALKDIVDNCSRYSRFAIENLFTITSLIDHMSRTERSLDMYENQEFL